MQKATFQGRTYLHPMIAERRREVAVSITALRMMQQFHDNSYYSFKCVSDAERADWYSKADEITPPVILEGQPTELSAAYERIAELETVLARVREAIDDPHAAPCSCASEGLLNDIDAAISEQVRQ